MTTPIPIAVLQNVQFSYDGGTTWALDGVNLSIASGERVAIVGANGSGKSTLGRIIAGLAAPDSGIVKLLGYSVFHDDAPNADAYRAARHDIGAVFQNPEDQIVTTVTEDDVAFGPENLGVARERIRQRITDALQQVGMDGSEARNPTRMSGGQQQRVAIAGMLAMKPRMLVLDEPTAMLDETARKDVMHVIAQLHDQGVTIVHITHREDEAASADRIIRMEHGRIIDDVTPTPEMPDAVTNDDSRSSSVFTTSAASPKRSGNGTPIVTLAHVSFAYDQRFPIFQDMSLSIDAGETVAIMGRNGCGKSTLTRLLCALETPDRGDITIGGIPVARDNGRRAVPLRRRDRHALRERIGYVMQHPERQLFAETVAQDVAYGPRNLGIHGDELTDRVSQTLDSLGLSHLADRSPFALSGGQHRMVSIAGVLACRPQILIMDEPTSSLDATAALRIHTLTADLKAQGVTVIIVTHDADEARLADRVIMLDGRDSMAVGPDSDAEPNDPDRTRTANATTSIAATPVVTRPSFIALLDPRMKMVLFLIMMFTAFAIGTPMQLALAAIVVAAILAASRLGPLSVLHSIRVLLALFVIMSALNVFFVRTGTPLAHIGPIPITDDGLWTALVYAGRLALVVILGAILLGTTTPVRLTDAFESLLSPLSRFGMHTSEIALTMSLALRFIPTLTREMQDVIDAQSARGGSVESGSPAHRIRALTAIIVPVFAGALRHADNLGLALDARSYEGGSHRTHYRLMRVSGRDIAFACAVIVYLAGLVALALIA